MLFYLVVFVIMFIIFYVFPSALTGLWFNYMANAESHHGTTGDAAGGAGGVGGGSIGIGNGISHQLPGNNGECVWGSIVVYRTKMLITLSPSFLCPLFCSEYHRRKDNGGGARIVLGLRFSPSMKLLLYSN